MKRKRKRNKFLALIIALLVILFLLLRPLESYCPTNGMQSQYQAVTKEEIVEQESEDVFVPNLQPDIGKVMQMEDTPFEQPIEEIVIYENHPNDINAIETGIVVITFGGIITEVLSWTLSLVF